MSETRRWKGDPIPATGDGQVHAPGPAAAADMLCQLKTDAVSLRRKLSEIEKQNQEGIRCMQDTNKLLQKSLDKAEEHTQQLISAVRELVSELKRK